MLLYCLFYLQLLLRWLITHMCWLLVTWRPVWIPPTSHRPVIDFSASSFRECQHRCMFWEMCLSRELLSLLLFSSYFLFSNTPLHEQFGTVFKCITQGSEDVSCWMKQQPIHHLQPRFSSLCCAVCAVSNWGLRKQGWETDFQPDLWFDQLWAVKLRGFDFRTGNSLSSFEFH